MSNENELITKKLEYLDETKQIIKQAIEAKGQSITDETTFREYADKIKAIESGSGDVKLFTTQEEMQNDTTAKEGDLAVVYRQEINNATSSSEISSIIFSDTVILPQAITSSSYCMLRAMDTSIWADGQVELTKTNFRFNFYSESSNYRVEYTSTDGITYTRTTDITNPINLEAAIKCYYEEEWSDNFGYFLQVTGNTFDGFFTYSAVTNKDSSAWVHILTGGKYEVNPFDYITKDEVYPVLHQIKEHFGLIKTRASCVKIGDTITFYINYAHDGYGKPYADALNLSIDSTGQFHMTKLTYDNHTAYYKIVSTDTSNFQEVSSDELASIVLEPDTLFTNVQIYEDETDLQNAALHTQQLWVLSDTKDDVLDTTGSWYRYVIAPSQLTLQNSNELLPGKIALGKNSIVIGNDSIYDNLDPKCIVDKMYNCYYPDSEYAICKSNGIIGPLTKDIAKCHYYKKTNNGVNILGKLDTIYVEDYEPEMGKNVDRFNGMYILNDTKTRLCISCYNPYTSYDYIQCSIYDTITKNLLWRTSSNHSTFLGNKGNICYYIDSDIHIYLGHTINNPANAVLKSINIDTLEETTIGTITNSADTWSNNSMLLVSTGKYNNIVAFLHYFSNDSKAGAKASFLNMDTGNYTIVKDFVDTVSSNSSSYTYGGTWHTQLSSMITIRIKDKYNVYSMSTNGNVTTLLENSTTSYPYTNNYYYEFNSFEHNNYLYSTDWRTDGLLTRYNKLTGETSKYIISGPDIKAYGDIILDRNNENIYVLYNTNTESNIKCIIKIQATIDDDNATIIYDIVDKIQYAYTYIDTKFDGGFSLYNYQSATSVELVDNKFYFYTKNNCIRDTIFDRCEETNIDNYDYCIFNSCKDTNQCCLVELSNKLGNSVDITKEEYDVAIETADDILGGEK